MKTKTNTLLLVVVTIIYWIGLCNASAFYDPGAQRWLNRDPIAELGGINLFNFCENDKVNSYDIFGLRGLSKDRTTDKDGKICLETCYCKDTSFIQPPPDFKIGPGTTKLNMRDWPHYNIDHISFSGEGCNCWYLVSEKGKWPSLKSIPGAYGKTCCPSQSPPPPPPPPSTHNDGPQLPVG